MTKEKKSQSQALAAAEARADEAERKLANTTKWQVILGVISAVGVIGAAALGAYGAITSSEQTAVVSCLDARAKVYQVVKKTPDAWTPLPSDAREEMQCKLNSYAEQVKTKK